MPRLTTLTGFLAAATVLFSPTAALTQSLMPEDYIAIQQLVSKYAYAIDECTNKGYDYADLYVPDGSFATARNGRISNRFDGREKLAEAARGGAADCKDVPWAGIVHMLVNHVIEPAAATIARQARSTSSRSGSTVIRAKSRRKAATRTCTSRRRRDGGSSRGSTCWRRARPKSPAARGRSRRLRRSDGFHV